MRRIAITNHKGGVGKTTTAVNLGAGLARRAKRVVLADLDPQASLTDSLGLGGQVTATVYDVMRGEAKPAEALVEVAGTDEAGGHLQVLPADGRMYGADLELLERDGREFLLRNALRSLRGFDFLLLDCPPNLGLMTINALTTAHEVFITLQPEFLPLKNIGKLVETQRAVKERFNPKLAITGIIATRFDRRKRLGREVLAKLVEYFGDAVFATAIRENVSLAEAPGFGLDVFRYRPNSIGAEDYAGLVDEILKRGGA